MGYDFLPFLREPVPEYISPWARGLVKSWDRREVAWGFWQACRHCQLSKVALTQGISDQHVVGTSCLLSRVPGLSGPVGSRPTYLIAWSSGRHGSHLAICSGFLSPRQYSHMSPDNSSPYVKEGS